MAEMKDSYTIEALLTGDTSRLKKAIDMANKQLDRLENRDNDGVEIDGDISSLTKKVQMAERMTKSLDNSKATVDVDANTSDVISDFANISRSSSKLDGQDVTIDVDANTNSVNEGLKRAEIMANLLDSKKVMIDVAVRNQQALIGLRQTKMVSEQLDDMKINIDADFDNSASNAKINAFKAMLKSIPNTIKSRVVVDFDKNQLSTIHSQFERISGASDKFQGRMDKIANSIRSFGTVIQNQIQGTLISSFSSAVPIVASLVPAVMAVGNALAVVGGGAIGLYGSFALLQGGLYTFAGMAKTALKMLEDGTLKASKASYSYQSALEGVKSKWQSIVQSNSTSIFNTMANGLNTLKSAMQALTPYFAGISKGMETASQKLLNWAKNSTVAQNAFKMLNTTGVSVFNDMLTGLGRFGDGFVALFTSFAPLFSWVSQGFANMGKSFQQWATSIETNKGIQNFINYTKTNLPIIGEIFGNVFLGIFNLFKAFGSNSQSIFEALAQMSAKFAEWSANISKSDGFQKFLDYVSSNAPVIMNLIGSLVMALINFGIAIAPLGQKVLGIVTAFTQWISKLFETNPAVAMLLGVAITLGGVLMSLIPTVIQLVTVFSEVILPLIDLHKKFGLVQTALGLLTTAFGAISLPVLAVIAVIGVLIGVFVYLWNTNESFRTAVIAIWEQIKSFITTAITVISTVVMAIWGALVAWWQANQQTIMTAVTTVWNAITTTISSVLTAVFGFVQTIWGGLVAWWQANNQLILQTVMTIWNLIAPFISSAIQIIVGIIQVGWGIITTVTSVAWNAIVAVVKIVWTLITTAIQIALTLIGGIIRVAMQIINGDWRGAWETIKATAVAIWELIKSGAIAIFEALKVALIAIWNGIKSGISIIVQGLQTFLTGAWNLIKTVITTAMNIIKTVLITGWNLIKATVTTVVNAIKAVITTVWNAIKTVVTTVINAIKSAVSNGFNAIKSTATNVMNAIKSAITNAWNAIKQACQNAINAIKSAVSNGFNAIKSTATNVMNGIKSTITNAWNSIKQACQNAMNAIKSAVTNGMNQVKSAVANGIQGAVSRARSFVGDMRSAGGQLINGMISGITAMAKNLIGAVQNVVGGAVAKAKALLKIHSPSRVFKEIGVYTMEGMAIGIEQEGRPMIATVADMANRATNAFNPQFDASLPNLAQNIKSATGNIASQVNADVVSTVRSEPNSTVIDANFVLGNRDYKAFVGDITGTQNGNVRLEEVYGIL